MAQLTLNRPDNPRRLPNTGEGTEFGDSFDEVVRKTQANFSEVYGGSVIFSSYVAAGSTLALTSASNRKTVKLDTATGSVVTLPAATGSGAVYMFLVTVLATTNSHVISAAGTDVMIGLALIANVSSGNATLLFAAQSTSNTLTLNRTATGSVSKGEWVTVEDVASGVWEVKAFFTANTTALTPFSHV